LPRKSVDGERVAKRSRYARATMTQSIENYALIGNLRCAALVGRNGSIDWWCVPNFDSPACFAALLGTREHGRWIVAPRGRPRRTERRYRDGTLVLETEFHNDEGSVRLVDTMAIFDGRTDIVRVVEGIRGRVAMHLELILRFGYGAVVPWVRRIDGS